MSDLSLSDAFLEQSEACHWIVDRSFIIQRIFGNASAVLGRPTGEMLGRPLDEGLGAQLGALWKDRSQRAFAGEVLHLRDRQGNTVWNISLFPIRVEGEIRYAGALAREVSPWQSAEVQLRSTVVGALKAIELDRKAMSRFLHDSVGQNLTAIGLQLDLMRMDLESLAPEICGRIAETQLMLEQMMESVREYSYELNPSTVERAGLRAALDRLCGRARGRFLGTLRLNVAPTLKLDPKVASSMYQIAHEAVENALQHASCSMIEVTVKTARGESYLEVKDNGRGFDPGDLPDGRRGLGILSMEHYAAQGGLEFAIESHRGAGTTVRATGGQAG